MFRHIGGVLVILVFQYIGGISVMLVCQHIGGVLVILVFQHIGGVFVPLLCFDILYCILNIGHISAYIVLLINKYIYISSKNYLYFIIIFKSFYKPYQLSSKYQILRSPHLIGSLRNLKFLV